MAEILKGMPVVKHMKESQLEQVEKLRENGVIPKLAIVRIGEKPDDLSYERGVIKRFSGVNIDVEVFEYPENISNDEFIKAFEKINNDDKIHGILLFRPLPKTIDEKQVISVFNPAKDMDGMLNENIAKVFSGDDSGYAPCTPQAVMELLNYYNIDLTGKKVTVVGRSMVVGKPLSMMLLKKNATVTICHTRTKDLMAECKAADIVIAAAGVAKMLNGDYISDGAIVIDVGINVDNDGNLCGDVDFDSCESKASMITPVPGGIGTVTTSVLAQHVIKAAMLKV